MNMVTRYLVSLFLVVGLGCSYAGDNTQTATSPAIPGKLLKQAFPVIFGSIDADSPPRIITLKGGIRIPLLTALQVLKVTNEASFNGLSKDQALLVCAASGTIGTHFMMLDCETNAFYNHMHHGNAKAPLTSPVCRLENPTAQQMRRTWREGLIPYAVAVRFSGTRINKGALRHLLEAVPEPVTALCPRIEG